MSQLIAVFQDGYHIPGLALKEFVQSEKEFRAFAAERMEITNADHVVYSHREYDTKGTLVKAHLYSGLEMDDETFYNSTKGLSGFVGALHNHKHRFDEGFR